MIERLRSGELQDSLEKHAKLQLQIVDEFQSVWKETAAALSDETLAAQIGQPKVSLGRDLPSDLRAPLAADKPTGNNVEVLPPNENHNAGMDTAHGNIPATRQLLSVYTNGLADKRIAEAERVLQNDKKNCHPTRSSRRSTT